MADSANDGKIREILSSYIEGRTRSIQSAGNVFVRPNTTSDLTQFDNMVNAHHQALAELLPAMNLPELEAFMELVTSRLAYIRMHKMPKGYRG